MRGLLRTYDDWRTTDPADELPEGPRRTVWEHCEHCGASLEGFSVVKCRGCGAYSYYPARPERRGGK